MYEPAIAVLSLLLCACAGEPDAAPTDGPVSDAGEPGDPGSALDAGAGEPDTEPGADRASVVGSLRDQARLARDVTAARGERHWLEQV